MSLNSPLTDWRGKTVWLLGASTGIGRATAAALHAQGAKVIVSARDLQTLQAFEQAHPGSRTVPLDATDLSAVHAAADAVFAQGRLDVVVYCAGYYTEQRATDFHLAEMERHWQVNYVGALYLLDAVLPRLIQQGRAHISVVSSVAGYRGLPQSLAYGPTKAALTNLAETLYSDLVDQGVGVSVINPGFVQTPLTAQNDFKMPALISPEQAAAEILSGWARGEFEIHFPKRFTRWMKVLRVLPNGLYFRIVARLRKPPSVELPAQVPAPVAQRDT
jgi:NAD(P)-dependent dehydrogenase (short-subunit alcohol dehydrogenase family)